MIARPYPFGRSVFHLLFLLSILFVGLWLVERKGEGLWGLIIVCIAAFLLIKALFNLIGAALHASKQIELQAESRKASGQFGRSRLAIASDKIIHRMSGGHGLIVGAFKNKPLFFNPFEPGYGHILTIAPTRTGKSSCLIIPNLLFWNGGSLFVTDVKAELAYITAQARKRLGQRIIFLNPFNVLGLSGACFNPLSILVDDIIHNYGKELSYLTRLIAFQLLPEKNDASDGEFFRNGARRELIALMLYLAVFLPNECHLPKLRAFVWSSAKDKQEIAEKMQSVDWFRGLVREYGNALAEMLDPDYIRTYGGFRDNAMAAVEIYDASSEFGKALLKSDFSLKDVITEKTTIYCILPENKTQSHGKWQGLITSLLFETIGGSDKNNPFLFMLEEMGNIGRIANLSKALSLLPGKGCRCWMVFQSRIQPEIIYGRNMRSLIEDQCSFVQQWSIQDPIDKKRWSERIGTTTKKTRSVSRDSREAVTPWRVNVSERGAPYMSTDRIGQMNRDLQLIDIDGEPVICCEKIPYFQIEPFRSISKPHPFHPEGYPKDKPVRFHLKREKTK